MKIWRSIGINHPNFMPLIKIIIQMISIPSSETSVERNFLVAKLQI
jgi:hypothetical protein